MNTNDLSFERIIAYENFGASRYSQSSNKETPLMV